MRWFYVIDTVLRRLLVTLTAMAIAGCSANHEEPAATPRRSVPHDVSAGSSPPRQTLDGDVALTLEVSELQGRRVRLSGTTNLPAGTELMLSVTEQVERGFHGGSRTRVSSGGTFQSEAFGPPGGFAVGRYTAEVLMPIPAVQPVEVKAVIGNQGEKLTGPLVQHGSFGITVSRATEFTIGGADAIEVQAQRTKQFEADAITLKKQLCGLLEELLEFKDQSSFREYGFGTGGPHSAWLKKVESIANAQPKGNHPIPLALRAAPGEMIMFAREYMKKGETDYTRFILPELKETIGFDEYLRDNTVAVDQTHATPKPPAQDTPSESIEESAPQPAMSTVSSASLRTWTDASGKFTIEAEFAGYAAGAVTLRKSDGSTISMPMEKLSQADQYWIRSRR